MQLMRKNSDFERMKAIARTYPTKRECSVQEAVYLVMPELWLRKTFPEVLFLNSIIPVKRYKIFQNKEEIDELPEDSNDIFQRNMLDRYIDQPDKISWVEDIVQLMPCVLQNFFHTIILHRSQ